MGVSGTAIFAAGKHINSESTATNCSSSLFRIDAKGEPGSWSNTKSGGGRRGTDGFDGGRGRSKSRGGGGGSDGRRSRERCWSRRFVCRNRSALLIVVQALAAIDVSTPRLLPAVEEENKASHQTQSENDGESDSSFCARAQS